MDRDALLVEELERWRKLVSIAPAFFGFLALDGTVLDLNDRAVDVIESAREAVVGRRFWECPWWAPVPPSAVRVRAAVEKAAAGAASRMDIEFWASIQRRGEVRWVALAISPLRDALGAVTQIAATGIDITDRKASEDALRRSQRQLDAILAHLPAAVYLKDREGRYLLANPRARKLKGESILGRTDAEIFPPGVAEAIAQHDRAVLATRAPIEFDEEIPTAQGPTTQLSMKFPVFGEDGEPVALGGISTDITERKLLEKLAETERRALERTARGEEFDTILAGIVESTEQLGIAGMASILILDADGFYLRSAAASRSLPAEIVSFTQRFPVGPAQGSCGTAVFRRERVVARDVASDPLWEQYRAIVLPLGIRSCWSTPIFNARGEPLGTFALYARQQREPSPLELRIVEQLQRTVSVILERQRAERERKRLVDDLGSAYARYQSLFDGTSEAILVIAPDGRFLDANRAAADLTGYSVAELRAMRLGGLADESGGIRGRWQDIQRDGRWSGEIGLRRKDGGSVPIETRITLVSLPSGPVYVSTMRDISERRALERLRRDFLAVVGHELRNPLNSILGSAEMMKAAGAYSARAVERIVRQTRQLERIVSDLQEAHNIETGRLRLRPRETDLVPLLRACTEEAAAVSGSHEVRFESAATQLQGMWDADRICQVLRNLLSNAIKYSPQGGVVDVRVDSSPHEVRVAVSDQGPGIARELLPRLFERYARSANATDSVPGMGIGLFVCKELIEHHGGNISAASEPGRGAVFTFTLPRAGASS